MAGDKLIPVGTYRGKLISVSDILDSPVKGTPYFNVDCEITEEGDYKGRRLIWSAYVPPNSAASQRTFQALLGSGWNEMLDGKWTGLGTKDQEFEIEHETYTPDATEANPNPKTITRARIKWVNNGPRGLTGKPVDSERKKSLFAAFAGDIQRAKTGSVETEVAADGSKVDKDGNLVDKSGKKLY